MSQTYFATTIPGLESALQDELRSLGARKVTTVRGGAEFQTTYAKFHQILPYCRTANRILLRVDSFRARDRFELKRKTERIDWTRWLTPQTPRIVKATAQTSHLIHTGLIEEIVTGAIGGCDPDDNPVLIQARLEDDRCTLSLDASGDLLYMRGWRQSAVAAPIRESTAAALLRLSDWDNGNVFDPTCGSGTFAIEAAQRHLGLPTSALRTFAFQRWACFDQGLWDEAVGVTPKTPTAKFVGMDKNPKGVEASKANALAAGVAACCDFTAGDALQCEPPAVEPGLVIFNPPYGERIDGKFVGPAILKHLATRFGGWRFTCVLPADVRVELKGAQKLTSFSNGGIDVAVWSGKFPSAQHGP